ncbi:MAG: hypothetical protein SPC78_03150 [Candidatus Faecousia sp.]|nr:hypothetical protein [Bacillota bacterium]MDY4598616.1 hypothetical protein [Candidatus Faecousia sp.]
MAGSLWLTAMKKRPSRKRLRSFSCNLRRRQRTTAPGYPHGLSVKIAQHPPIVSCRYFPTIAVQKRKNTFFAGRTEGHPEGCSYILV